MKQLTLRQAEAMLGLSKDSLRRQAGRGTIRAYKMGRDWIVDEDEVRRYEREHRRRRVGAINDSHASNQQESASLSEVD